MKKIEVDGYNNAMEMFINTESDTFKFYEYIKEKLDLIEGPPYLHIHLNCILSPLHIVVMTKCLIYITTKGDFVLVVSPLSDTIGEFLKEIGLWEFCQDNYRQPKQGNYSQKATCMGLWRINSTNMDEYTMHLQRYLGEYYKKNGVIKSCISELANNVCDHAKSPIDAYIFCQYIPQHNKLYIVIGDMGVGIPKTVRGIPAHAELTDDEAVKWALKPNNTAQSTQQNKGLGLDAIKCSVEVNGGELEIYSGSCHYCLSEDEENFFSINSFFKGTLISIVLNTENIEEEEVLTEVPDDWF